VPRLPLPADSIATGERDGTKAGSKTAKPPATLVPLLEPVRLGGTGPRCSPQLNNCAARFQLQGGDQGRCRSLGPLACGSAGGW